MDHFGISTAHILLRRDLIAQGWTDRDIATQVRSGVLTKVRWGAYILSHLVDGLDEVGQMRVRSRAVLRTAHPSSTLTHQSALAEYDVPLWGLRLDETHLTRPDGKSGRREAHIVHHRGQLTGADMRERHGVPVVSLPRATIEVILANRPEVGLVAACGSLNRGCTREELYAAAERAEHWPHSLHGRLVLARADERLTNVAEARTWHMFFEQSIPRPEPQVAVHDEHGVLLGIVDFAWREARTFLEFDGRIKYELFRRPGETLDAYLMREKRREEKISAATGWACIRIGWSDVENPVPTAQRIHRLLSRGTQPAA